MNEVGRIYDELHRIEAPKRFETFPVHKRLSLPGGQDLIEWITERIYIRKGQSVLDAGCGNGHTLFTIAQQTEINGLGVSLSEREISSATTYATKRDFQALQFKIQDFNSTFNRTFDWIIAIESLRHSPDFTDSVRNLVRHLTPSGMLILADEWMEETSLTKIHHALWKSSNPGSALDFQESLNNEKVTFEFFDLTHRVPVRNLIVLDGLIAILRILTKLVKNQNLKTYLGALILEKLYARGIAHYHIYFIKNNL